MTFRWLKWTRGDVSLVTLTSARHTCSTASCIRGVTGRDRDPRRRIGACGVGVAGGDGGRGGGGGWSGGETIPNASRSVSIQTIVVLLVLL